VSAHAQARERRLRTALAAARVELETFPGVTVIPPGDLAPAGGDHFKVFTPYWRRWRTEPRRPLVPAPERLAAPDGVSWRGLPTLGELVDGETAPELPRGGETVGRERLEAWLRDGLARYAEHRDDLAVDGTSRLSPYLHLGCISPLEVVERSLGRPGGEEFVRQLCWRDFHHQLLAARPELSREDMRPRDGDWTADDELLAEWKEGRTGEPIVDAGMRQLLREGWMHNRARLVVGSYLTKTLGIDWRAGAAHFFDLLVDGDVANNVGNWQWVAGTGADTRPYRKLSPQRQAERFDPDGAYVARYAPEHAREQLAL
jgi:deoxyribodipyrimidine photo-lyase